MADGHFRQTLGLMPGAGTQAKSGACIILPAPLYWEKNLSLAATLPAATPCYFINTVIRRRRYVATAASARPAAINPYADGSGTAMVEMLN